MSAPRAPHLLVTSAGFVRRLVCYRAHEDALADPVAQGALARAVARPPARRRRPWTWLVVLALAGGAVVLGIRGGGGGRSEDAAPSSSAVADGAGATTPPPALAADPRAAASGGEVPARAPNAGGALPAARGPDASDAAAPASTRGVVVDEAGVAVGGATVVLVPKGVRGLNDLPAATARTDEHGQFVVAAACGGHFIGAYKTGLLAGHADGDARSDAEGHRIVLSAGPSVRVRLLPDDRPFPAGVVVAMGADRSPDATLYPAPGGGALAFASATILGPEGVDVRIGTRGPIRLSLTGIGGTDLVEPAQVRLERAEGEVTFRRVPSCRLDLRVVDGEDRPFLAPYQAVLLDADSDAVVVGMVSGGPQPGGVFAWTNGLHVGRHRLRVTSAGHRTFTSPPFSWVRAGDEVAVRAVLVPDPARAVGALRLSLPMPAVRGVCWYRDPKGATPVRDVAVLVRPQGGAWSEPGGWLMEATGSWRIWERAWDPDARVLRIGGLARGSYDAIVWDLSTWTCAFAGDLEVESGQVIERTLALVVGVRVHPSEWADAGGEVRGVRLRAGSVEGLPAYERSAAGQASMYGAEGRMTRDAALAPLPFPRIEATVGQGSAARSFVFEAAPPK